MDTREGGHIGERVRQVREARGLTQAALAGETQALAERVGVTALAVSQPHLSRIEAGATRSPSFDAMAGLALALDVPLDAFAVAVGEADWPTLLRDIESVPPGPAFDRHLLAIALARIDARVRAKSP